MGEPRIIHPDRCPGAERCRGFRLRRPTVQTGDDWPACLVYTPAISTSERGGKMPDFTPEVRLHKLARRLTAQANTWSTFHSYRIILDRAGPGGTRGFLITFQALDGDLAVTVRASLEGGMASVRGRPSNHGTKGELNLTGSFSYGGREFEGADELAERLGDQVEGEFVWMESQAEGAEDCKRQRDRRREPIAGKPENALSSGPFALPRVELHVRFRVFGWLQMIRFPLPGQGLWRVSFFVLFRLVSPLFDRICPWICPWPVALPQATP